MTFEAALLPLCRGAPGALCARERSSPPSHETRLDLAEKGQRWSSCGDLLRKKRNLSDVVRCHNEGKGMSKPDTSSRRVTSVVLRNGLAVVSVAVALGLALVAQSRGIQHVEFPLSLMAVAATVWYAGAMLGVLAVVLAGLGFNYLFTQPLYTLYIEPSDRPVFVVFLFSPS